MDVDTLIINGSKCLNYDFDSFEFKAIKLAFEWYNNN